MEGVGREVWLPLWLLWRPQVQQHFGHESFVEEQGRVRLQEQGEGEEEVGEAVVFCSRSLPLSSWLLLFQSASIPTFSNQRRRFDDGVKFWLHVVQRTNQFGRSSSVSALIG